jgi:tripartite-type tricarboxylate transporter receptor subunit TctC
MMDILPNSMPYLKSGQLRALAVTSIARSPDLPDVPTLAEAGLPGYEVQNWYGVLAPLGTPAPIVKLLNEAISVALTDPRCRTACASRAIRPPRCRSSSSAA